ncbi:MAG: putative metallopeptidase [archaeon]
MVIKYIHAPDIKRRIIDLAEDFPNVTPERIYCFRSHGSTSERILARIWSFPKIWQLALYMNPRYVIEVLSERFDKLPQHKQDEVLIHELKHIPKMFTGGLRKHDKKKLPKFIRI